MNVPFVDLKAQYAAIKEEVDAAMQDVVSNTAFIGGERLSNFEKNFAAYTEAKHGVGASSGTSAIHLALAAMGIGEGDEVITAANTFIATTEAISHAGATPVLVDVDDDTQTIDPNKIEDAITDKTRVIMPVHLYGQPADMDAVRDIASRRGLRVVSDASQSHGAKYKGSRAGTLGEVTTYSFYPGKNLGAYGDAGAIVTDDADIAARAKMLADHGSYEKYKHDVEGYNYRLDTLQAAVLNVKLGHIDAWTEGRRAHAKRYDAAFANSAVRPVFEAPDRYHVYHLYVVRTPERDRLRDELGKRGVASGIHYPIPLHLQPAYKHLPYKQGDFPITEQTAEQQLSLPMFAELTDDMVDYVVASVNEILS